MQSVLHAIVHPSVCHVSKTVEIRIVQLSPKNSPVRLVFAI